MHTTDMILIQDYDIGYGFKIQDHTMASTFLFHKDTAPIHTYHMKGIFLHDDDCLKEKLGVL